MGELGVVNRTHLYRDFNFRKSWSDTIHACPLFVGDGYFFSVAIVLHNYRQTFRGIASIHIQAQHLR